MTVASLRHAAFPLLDRALKGGASLVAGRFAAREPLSAQRAIFLELLSRGSATRFGRDHGLAELAALPFEQAYLRYRSRVPVRSYADFWREYFSGGCLESEHGRSLLLEDVTWPGRIPFFCETSGTTAPSKFIPFSAAMFAANRRAALDLVCCYLSARRDSRLLQGKLLYMAGNTQLSDLGQGVKSGDMSAITLRHRPRYLDPFIAPDAATAALPWEQKLEAMARLLLSGAGVRGISGVPPWILLLLKRCSIQGGKPLAQLVPGLELIIHGGTSLAPYKNEFAALFPDRGPQFLELLPSSEAFMAFQTPGEERMRLAPYYGVFFEFLPAEELDERGGAASDARCLPLAEIEVGRRYAVILTTCAGLWRYHIGDTIRFHAREPLFIEFTGRDKFLDRFEEKVTQGEVEEAVARANRLPGVDIREFMVGPAIAERRHLWVLAMGAGGEKDPARLGAALDGALRAMNADYGTFRAQGRIGAPLVVPVGEEEIYRWSKEVRGKLGGQSKIPHVDPTLEGELVQSLARFAGGSEAGIS